MSAPEAVFLQVVVAICFWASGSLCLRGSDYVLNRRVALGAWLWVASLVLTIIAGTVARIRWGGQ